MPTFTCDPNTEIDGHAAIALVKSINFDQYKPILEKHDLLQLDAEQWYPLQPLLSVLQEIARLPGGMMNLVSIGKAASDVAEFPPDVEKLSALEFLKLYEQVYPTRHRDGDAGFVKINIIDENQAQIIMQTPYPDDLMYGVMYGYVHRFRQGQYFTLSPDKQQTENNGSYVILVTME